MNLVKMVQMRLPVGTFDEDDIIEVLQEAAQQIKNFCNIPQEEDVPTGALYVQVNIAADILLDCYKRANPGSPVGFGVTGTSVGGTSFSYGSLRDSGQVALDAYLMSYTGQLTRFRRIGFGNNYRDTSGDDGEGY